MPSLTPTLTRTIDEIFERYLETGRAPGVAYGVILGGALVHAGGLGTVTVGLDARPDERSVFRIASMTKSFTAAAILLLRDRGMIRLDEPVSTYVPEASALRGTTADAPAVTVRHLLSMQGGLPTDDPWGDRLQDLDPAGFDALLAGGQTMAWTPGTQYEYSNLGYAILGRLITNVTGTVFDAFIGDELLGPVGMSQTVWRLDEVDAAHRSHGYVDVDGAWQEEPIQGHGAFAAMGGLFSTIADLARWVGGYAEAWPPRDEPNGHPLARASRREQQRPITTAGVALRPDHRGSLRAVADGYCLGLVSTEDLELGRAVGHSGGYPGYGSHMRWHPSTGLGVVALANGRYARTEPAATDALAALIAGGAAPYRRPRPHAAVAAAVADVERLLASWDDALADRLFAPNVDLDEPLTRRRSAIEQLVATHGPLRRGGEIEASTPTGAEWTLAGDRGHVRADLLLNAEVPPRVQALGLVSVPTPSAALEAAIGRVVAAINQAGDLDAPAAAARLVRSAHPALAPCVVVSPVGGDGETTTVFRVRGRQSDADLTVSVDASGALVDLELEAIRPTRVDY
jgi:CubicO group peptidase (beta-lactamase class C family)